VGGQNKAFLPNIGQERPQILILEGHDSHNFIELTDNATENNIHIIELPAQTSNWLQPCGQTVCSPVLGKLVVENNLHISTQIDTC